MIKFNYIAALVLLSDPEVIIRLDDENAFFHVITKDGEFIADEIYDAIKMAFCASEWKNRDCEEFND